jgi:hypothetical protein
MENGGGKCSGGFWNTKYYDMTFIDNAIGFMALGSNQMSGGLSTLMLNDIKVYGEYAPILDCPDQTDDSYCFNKSKTAWGINGYTRDCRASMEEQSMAYPYNMIISDAVTEQRMVMERNQFINFDRKTVMGNNQTILYLNDH